MDSVTVRLCRWIVSLSGYVDGQCHCQVMQMDRVTLIVQMDRVTVRLCRWIVSLSGYVDG